MKRSGQFTLRMHRAGRIMVNSAALACSVQLAFAVLAMKQTHCLLLIAGLLASHCAGIASSRRDGSPSPAQNSAAAVQAKPHRDWKRFPAIVQIDSDEDLCVIGDPHADSDRLKAVLLGPNSDPSEVTWTAGKAIVVFTGDYR